MEKQEFNVAPHSKESEMMVLGSMLTSVGAYNFSAELLTAEDFFFEEHKTVFKTLKHLHDDKRSADVHIVCEELQKSEKLKSVGGPSYIVTLAQYAGTSAHIEEYCEIIEEKAKLRQIIKLGDDIQKNALNNVGATKILTDLSDQSRRILQRQSLKEKFPLMFLTQFDRDFLLDPPKPKPMLMEYVDDNGKPMGFLPKSIVAMLVGAGGVGKTHLIAQLTISVSTGTPWLDVFSPTSHCGLDNKGYVFLGLGENQIDDIHRVLYKASKMIRNQEQGRKMLGDARKRIMPFSFCGQQAAFLEGGRPSRYFRELKLRLCESAPENGWSLIILDPVSRLLGVDSETDNAAATQFIALLEELTLDVPGNPTVLFAHHVSKSAIQQTGKQNQTAARGASALTDGVRWQINFQKKNMENNSLDQLALLHMQKSNFTAIMDDIVLKKDFEGYLNVTKDSTLNEDQQKTPKKPLSQAEQYASLT